MAGTEKVLIVGSGAREHALGWEISKSPKVSEIFFAPGNAGTSQIGKNIDIKTDEITHLADFARDQEINLTVVGPEKPLELGIVNYFHENHLRIFGPTLEAARLETSKVFATRFMSKHSIRHPFSIEVDNFNMAERHLANLPWPPEIGVVVKADGLAGGKGVFIPDNINEALAVCHDILVDKCLKDAGNTILIQEKLEGTEASVIAISDGTNYKLMPIARDFKRLYDGDRGPNTGGMGAIAPVENIEYGTLSEIRHGIIEPTIAGMKKEDTPFVGALYAGLMIGEHEINVLEYNVRFGDPETQVQMPLISSDFYETLSSAVDGRLNEVNFDINDDMYSLCVVLAARGYPDKPILGERISGLDKPSVWPNVQIFHAGTKNNNGFMETSGGRVLSVVGVSNDPGAAKYVTYSSINQLNLDNLELRHDIKFN